MNKIHARYSRGFTLVEILIAVSVFSILMIALFSSFKAFINSGNTLKNEISKSDIMKIPLKIIYRDLESIHISHYPGYSVPEFDSPPDMFRISGDMVNVRGYSFSRLRFASRSSLSFDDTAPPGKPIQTVLYYVRPNNEDGFDLCRSDTPVFSADTEEKTCDPVLFGNIEKFELIYIDDKGKEHSYWNSEEQEFDFATPVAIIIKIQAENIGKIKTAINLPSYRKML